MPRMPQLNDLQLILLSHAAKARSGSMFPLPDSVADPARARKELAALLDHGLLAETETTRPAASWREDGDLHFGLVITPEGCAAIGLGDDEADAPCTEPTGAPREVRGGSKIANVLALLRRSEGATLSELTEATGWLPHTTRAALTGLRKKGHEVVKAKRDEVTCYSIAGAR